MAAFFGQVAGGRGVATRTGTRNIRTSVQSWDGSVITELSYNSEDKLMVEVRADDYSTAYGNRIFYGTYEEFINKLKS
jgi:hypothetical protein